MGAVLSFRGRYHHATTRRIRNCWVLHGMTLVALLGSEPEFGYMRVCGDGLKNAFIRGRCQSRGQAADQCQPYCSRWFYWLQRGWICAWNGMRTYQNALAPPPNNGFQAAPMGRVLKRPLSRGH